MDRTVQLIKIILPGVDSIPIAGRFIKPSLELVIVICELAEKVTANREKLIDLALYVARLLTAIAMECQRVGMSASGLRVEQLVELQRTLEEIRDAAEAMKAKGIVGRTWDVDEDKAELNALRNKLDQTVSEFTVVSSIRSLAEVESSKVQMKNLQKAIEELKSELEQHKYLDAAEQGRLSALRPVLSARHDHEFARSGCLQNTREILLAEIFDWAGKEKEKVDDRIYWLTGLGGTGKTTIAQTVSKRLAASSPSKLAASFFFSRYQSDCKSPATVVRTIAYHLASLTPQLRSLISGALRENPDIPSRCMQDQARILLVEPLSKASDLSSPIVFVFDALDECEGNGTDLMTVLANSLIHSLPEVHVKIFVTSRLEPEIKSMFESIPHKPYKLHDIEASVAQGDIRAYYIASFARIKRKRHNPSLETWPSEEDIATLMERTGVLFIFAATVIKYIDVHLPPGPRLRTLLSTDVVQDGRYKTLDDLYLQVMRSAVDDSLDEASQEMQCTRVRNAAATIVILQDPLPAHALSQLLALDFSETVEILGELSAVLLLPDNLSADTKEVIRLLHPSFPDFIINASRCIDPRFLVDQLLYHKAAAERCLSLMIVGLKRDICGIRNPSLLNSEIANLQTRISEHIPVELAYACKYWLVHLRLASVQDYTLLKSLEIFCEEKIFEWIECCSLLDILPVVLTELQIMVSQITNMCISNRTAALLCDTERLMMEFYVPISSSALHVYYSAAPLLPYCALLERVVRPDSNFPRLLTRREKKWNPTLQAIDGNSGFIITLTISLDGLRLASGSHDGSVRIWDARTGGSIARLDGHSGFVNTVAFSPDDTRVASGGNDWAICIWDAVTFSLIAKLSGHSAPVLAVCFSPDAYGAQLVSGSRDSIVRIWDVLSKTCLVEIGGHIDQVRDVIFSHDGSRIISCSDDRSIRIWNSQTGSLINQLNGHYGPVYHLTVTHDYLRIISASKDRTIKIWDINTGKHMFSLRGHSDAVNCVALTPDDSHILSGSEDNTIRIWSMQKRACVQVLSSHFARVTSIAILPNGLRFFSGSYDGTIRVWDLSSLIAGGSLPSGLIGKRDRLKTWISSSILNARQAMAGIRERGAYVVESLFPEFKALPSFEVTPSFDVTPDGTYIVTGHVNHSICLWDQSGERLIRKLSGHSKRVSSVTFSSDGVWIVSGSDDKTVRIWEVESGNPLASMKGHAERVDSVAISPDRGTIASASSDKTIRLWRTGTWSLQHTLKGHGNLAYSVAFSSDSRRVASGSWDRTLRIWDTATGDLITVLRIENLIFHVRFCCGDSQIAAIDDFNEIHIWDLQADAFLELETYHPSVFHIDRFGWVWGPIVPEGPAYRLCWLPVSRQSVRSFLPDTFGYSRTSRTNVITTIFGDGLITRLDISCTIAMMT